MPTAHIRHTERGSVTVEAAIIMPVVVFLLALVAAFGGAIATQVRANESARMVARAVAAGETDATATARGDLNSPHATITITHNGDAVTVRVTQTVSGLGALVSRDSWQVSGVASTVVERALISDAPAAGLAWLGPGSMVGWLLSLRYLRPRWLKRRGWLKSRSWLKSRAWLRHRRLTFQASERGSSLAIGITTMCIIALVTAALMATAVIVRAQAHSDTGADLAAIGAAQDVQAQQNDPCGTAARIAARNAVALSSCTIGADEAVTVTTRHELPQLLGILLGPRVGHARAGPATLAP